MLSYFKKHWGKKYSNRIIDLGILENNYEIVDTRKIIKTIHSKSNQKQLYKFVQQLFNIFINNQPHLCKLKALITLSIILNDNVEIADLIIEHKYPEQNIQNDFKEENINDFIKNKLVNIFFSYLLRLSANIQIYQICKNGFIPNNQIFRRGNHIRVYWLFKIFNIVNFNINLLSNIINCLKKHNQFLFKQLQSIVINDLIIIYNLLVNSIQQIMTDYILMPYVDLLHMMEVLNQIEFIEKKLEFFYDFHVKHCRVEITLPQRLKIGQKQRKKLQKYVTRVKLINETLRGNGQIQQYQEKIKELQNQGITIQPSFRDLSNKNQKRLHTQI